MVSALAACAVAAAALWIPAASATAQGTTGSTFNFALRHERETGATTRTGQGIVAGSKARLRFDAVGGSNSPIGPNATVHVTGAGDPLEALVISDDSTRMLVRPARRLADMRRMIARTPRAPVITARLLSMRADTAPAEERFAGLPARRHRASGQILIVFSASPDDTVAAIPDTMRVSLDTEVLSSWATPGAVDPFRGIQTLDLLLTALAGGNPVISAETGRILGALPNGLPLRSEWTVAVTRNGRTRTEREIVELSRVGNAAVSDADVAVPDYPEAPSRNPI